MLFQTNNNKKQSKKTIQQDKTTRWVRNRQGLTKDFERNKQKHKTSKRKQKKKERFRKTKKRKIVWKDIGEKKRKINDEDNNKKKKDFEEKGFGRERGTNFEIAGLVVFWGFLEHKKKPTNMLLFLSSCLLISFVFFLLVLLFFFSLVGVAGRRFRCLVLGVLSSFGGVCFFLS